MPGISGGTLVTAVGTALPLGRCATARSAAASEKPRGTGSVTDQARARLARGRPEREHPSGVRALSRAEVGAGRGGSAATAAKGRCEIDPTCPRPEALQLRAGPSSVPHRVAVRRYCGRRQGRLRCRPLRLKNAWTRRAPPASRPESCPDALRDVGEEQVRPHAGVGWLSWDSPILQGCGNANAGVRLRLDARV